MGAAATLPPPPVAGAPASREARDDTSAASTHVTTPPVDAPPPPPPDTGLEPAHETDETPPDVAPHESESATADRTGDAAAELEVEPIELPPPRERTAASRATVLVRVLIGLVVLVVVILAVYVVATGSGSSGAPAGTTLPDGKRRITGTFTLTDTGVAEKNGSCVGTGDYSDFGPGMDVTITDQKGTVLGDTVTKASTVTKTDTVTDAGSGANRCVVEFSSVVDDADSYTITIGERGAQTYSRAELEADGWQADLSLG